MISMQGVPSSLILRNESWVRKQAQAFMRHLPSNVEKADLIQVGLIGVAQAALAFVWEGDRESEEAKEAFVRYARMRVKGAMLDELRQMDHLGREQRRKVKVMQVATERWRGSHGSDPTATELSQVCGMDIDEIFELSLAARSGETTSLSDDPESDGVHSSPHEPATAKDEVEARVDTGMLMRRLETFFATLPERERQVIDAYMGIGMSTEEVAESLGVSTSRVSQIYQATVKRIGQHFAQKDQRALDKYPVRSGPEFETLLAKREAQAPWGTLLEQALTAPGERFGARGRRKATSAAAANGHAEGDEAA